MYAALQAAYLETTTSRKLKIDQFMIKMSNYHLTRLGQMNIIEVNYSKEKSQHAIMEDSTKAYHAIISISTTELQITG